MLREGNGMSDGDRTDLTRERQLVQTFVALADTLVDRFDVVEFLHMLTERTVELGLASESGILLRDSDGQLHVMAASQERTRLLELFQLQSREGPCLDACRTQRVVSVADLDDQHERWPSFTPKALAVGFQSVDAIPMALRGMNLGALNLFHTRVGVATSEDQVVARALADVATIGLVQQRTVRESQAAAEQLQQALHSRIAIEQAKGMLAERAETGVNEAFTLLRHHARNNNLRLSDLAQAYVDGEVLAESILPG
jgi:GAF domain-containing protein